MKRLVFLFIVLVFLAGMSTAAFNENMEMGDEAEASVDRPPINHLKAFLNDTVPPLYNLIDSSGDQRSG